MSNFLAHLLHNASIMGQALLATALILVSVFGIIGGGYLWIDAAKTTVTRSPRVTVVVGLVLMVLVVLVTLMEMGL